MRKSTSLVLCVLVLSLSACARTPAPTTPPETLTIAGSSAALPLLEQLARAFEARHPTITVVVEAHSTVRAVAQVAERRVALAAVAGAPSEQLWSAPIALDAIAIVVHADNPLQTLTLAQLYDIFVGRTWHWSELGARLAEDEIMVVSRQVGSGTRAAFDAQVMAQGPSCRPIVAFELDGTAPGGLVPEDKRRQSASQPTTDERSSFTESPPCEPDAVTSTALLRMDNAAVIEYVAEHPSAIGYIARSYLDTGKSVRALRIEGVSPNPAQVADGSYRLSMPLYLVAASDVPADGISAGQPSGTGPAGAARQFVDYCLGSEGQSLVAQQYVPVRKR